MENEGDAAAAAFCATLSRDEAAVALVCSSGEERLRDAGLAAKAYGCSQAVEDADIVLVVG